MAAPSVLLLALTFLGFISLGLPDAITGVVWPSVSSHFGIPLGNLGILLVSFTAGYLAASFSLSRLLRKLGVGGLLAGSCAVVTLSLLGFALTDSWAGYLASAILAGLGAGAIDTGLNAYAARHFSARHMSWLHACWGLGASSGAMISASVLARGYSWRWAFGGVALLMAPITVLFTLFRRRWNGDPGSLPPEGQGRATGSAPLAEALRHPLVWVQALIFFIYVGAESTVGQWAFTLLSQYRDLKEGSAGLAVSLYWASLTAGRFVLGAIADRVGIRQLVSVSVSAALLGAVVFAAAPWIWASALGLMIIGVSLAPLYPGLMSQTPARMGRLSDSTIGFQVAMAVVGQVTWPSVGGQLVKVLGLPWLNALPVFLLLLLWIAVMALFRSGPAAGGPQRQEVPQEDLFEKHPGF